MSENEQPWIVPTEHWQTLEDGRVQCDICPRECRLREGQRGFCFVRQNLGGEVVLTTYGRSSGFCIDPIEKKPLNHFYPGTPVLSFGTAGCNLGCKFCQNWDISKSREFDTLADQASPEAIAKAAADSGCTSVAFTYNDPVIFMEYAIDCIDACKEMGIKTVAVTAGYIKDAPRRQFYSKLDAANVDLKAFTDDFYRKITFSELQPVLDSLLYLKHETDVWFELTTLVIPDENDSTEEVEQMSQWVVENLGPDVPMHFSAFHPDFKMRDKPRTSPETLKRVREIAMKNGVRYAYLGNIHDADGDTTFCPGCNAPVIIRDWYELNGYALHNGRCLKCDTQIAGRFGEGPGDWGRKRQRVDMRTY